MKGIKCPKCLTQNVKEAKFCRHCGEKLASQHLQNASNASHKDEKGCIMAGFLFIFGPFAAFVFILGGICALFGGEAIAGVIMIIIGILIVVIINKNDTD